MPECQLTDNASLEWNDDIFLVRVSGVGEDYYHSTQLSPTDALRLANKLLEFLAQGI